MENEDDAIEAYLVSKIIKRGLPALTNDEVSVAFHSRSFGKEWVRITGSAMPDKLRTAMTDRMEKQSHNPSNRRQFGAPSGIPPQAASLPADQPRELPLHVAIVSGDADKVREVLTRAENLRDVLEASSDTSRRTAIHLAARQGDVAILELLVDFGASIESRDGAGRTALHVASEYGRGSACGLLMRLGSDPETQDGAGRSAFHLSCCSETTDLPLIFLSRRPALLENSDRYGRTGLFYAAMHSNESAGLTIVRSLIQRHCNVNRRDAVGRTALHYAAEAGREAVVEALVQAGIDVSVIDGNGKTASDSGGEGVKRVIRLGVQERGIDSSMKVSGDSSPVLRAPVSFSSIPLYREKFLKILTKAQATALAAFLHVKRPLLFSGAWMEDVTASAEVFGPVFGELSPAEAVFRVFNLLFPPKKFAGLPSDQVGIQEALSKKAITDDGWDVEQGITGGIGNSSASSGTLASAKRLNELKVELEVRERLIAELRGESQSLKEKLEFSVSAVDLRMAQEDVGRLRQDLLRAEIALQEEKKSRVFAEEKHRELIENSAIQNSGPKVESSRPESSENFSETGHAALAIAYERLKRAEARADSLALEKGALTAELRRNSCRPTADPLPAGQPSEDAAFWKAKCTEQVNLRLKSELPLISRLMGLHETPGSVGRFVFGVVGGKVGSTGNFYVKLVFSGSEWRSKTVASDGRATWFEEWEINCERKILDSQPTVTIEYWLDPESPSLPHLLIQRFTEEISDSAGWKYGFRENRAIFARSTGVGERLPQSPTIPRSTSSLKAGTASSSVSLPQRKTRTAFGELIPEEPPTQSFYLSLAWIPSGSSDVVISDLSARSLIGGFVGNFHVRPVAVAEGASSSKISHGATSPVPTLPIENLYILVTVQTEPGKSMQWRSGFSSNAGNFSADWVKFPISFYENEWQRQAPSSPFFDLQVLKAKSSGDIVVGNLAFGPEELTRIHEYENGVATVEVGCGEGKLVLNLQWDMWMGA